MSDHAESAVELRVRDPVAAWPRSLEAAREWEARLRVGLELAGGPARVRSIAGADLAYRADARWAWAAVAVLAWPDGRLIDVGTAAGPPGFPYLPGFLTLREGPLLLAAFERLRERPDLCVFDAHGLAHPRRFGLACRLGVLLDLPAVGCAKSWFVGEYREPESERGAWSPILLDGKRVGAAVRTRSGVRPVFVSPGHRIGLPEAVRWVLACARFRVPEPIRQAEQIVNRLRCAATR